MEEKERRGGKEEMGGKGIRGGEEGGRRGRNIVSAVNNILKPSLTRF